ncbi:MAG: ABC transporter substrate-binding protein [Negativicutes bacterium]|nr:ABC transporter substrate-binding protein [Negativicutes bacterium]
MFAQSMGRDSRLGRHKKGQAGVWQKLLLIAGLLAVMMLWPAAGKAAPTIRIGGNLELSGGIAAFGQAAQNGAQLAFREMNAAGGLLGRQVEFVVLDNAGQPANAQSVAERLINQENVVAMLGCTASSDTIAASFVTEKFQVPLLSPSGVNALVTKTVDGTTKPYTFRACFVDPYQGVIMAKFALNSLQAKTAAVIIDNSSKYSKELAGMFEAYFTANGGKVAAKEYYQPRDKDFQSQLERVRGANPDVVFIPGYFTDAGLIVKQAREMGIQASLLGGDGWDSQRMVALAGVAALNNTYFSNHYIDNNTPRTAKFKAAYMREYGQQPDALAVLGYEAALILGEAIKKAGSSEPGKIRTALESVTVEGLLGPIRMTAWHDPLKSAVVVRLVEGQQTFYQKIDP